MMTDKVRRTPQGVRGLKWDIVEIMHSLYRSHPARGAWIEMLEYDVPSARPRRTPQGVRGLKSSRRRKWPTRTLVAPRKGCVD